MGGDPGGDEALHGAAVLVGGVGRAMVRQLLLEEPLAGLIHGWALRYTSRAGAGSPPPLASEIAAFALVPVDGVLELTPGQERDHLAAEPWHRHCALSSSVARSVVGQKGSVVAGSVSATLGAGRLMVYRRRSGRKDPVFH